MKVSTRRPAFLGLALLIGLFGTPSAGAIGLTGFLQNASPGSRAGIGFAISVPLFTEIITFEGEYSRARAKVESPSLTIWSGKRSPDLAHGDYSSETLLGHRVWALQAG